MKSNTKFFFESEDTPEENNTFFETLQKVGVIQDNDLKVQPEAEMKSKQSRLVLIEYGPYQGNYAVHITPINEKKNLASEESVKKALREFVVILNEYVPYTINVNLHLPRPDWKLKVITAVVVKGATAWNFDSEKLELEGIPKIMRAVENVIMSSR